MKQKLHELWGAIYALPLAAKVPLFLSYLILLVLPSVTFRTIGSGACSMAQAVVQIMNDSGVADEAALIALDQFIEGYMLVTEGLVYWLFPAVFVAWIIMIPIAFMVVCSPPKQKQSSSAQHLPDNAAATTKDEEHW